MSAEHDNTARLMRLAEEKRRLEKAGPALLNAVDLCFYFLVGNYPEHAEPEEPCDGEGLCRECEQGGCIQMRIVACRNALNIARPASTTDAGVVG